MKLLIVLALLGAAAAQYQVYTGLRPYTYNHAALRTTPYVSQLGAYPFGAYPYGARPHLYAGLPYAFQPVKAAEEVKPAEEPVVESRAKRDVLPKSGSVAIHAANAFPYNAFNAYHYTYPSAYGAYAAPTAYTGAPIAYSGFHHPYSPVVHSLKKRDTEAAEDQKADDTTFISTYAAHPYAYNTAFPYAAGHAAVRGFPYAHSAYSAFPYNYNYGTYRYVY